jgi:hypothetical protein
MKMYKATKYKATETENKLVFIFLLNNINVKENAY